MLNPIIKVNKAITFMYQTPYTTLAVAGKVLQLQCILAGYPLPSYRWFKNDVDATLVRYRIIVFNVECHSETLFNVIVAP